MTENRQNRNRFEATKSVSFGLMDICKAIFKEYSKSILLQTENSLFLRRYISIYCNDFGFIGLRPKCLKKLKKTIQNLCINEKSINTWLPENFSLTFVHYIYLSSINPNQKNAE